MIGYLKGEVVNLEANKLILLTSGGVGYEVGISDLAYGEVAEGSLVDLYIHHHIVEGGQSLFGFIELSEKKVFEELIKISGVGGKVALQILGLGVSKLSVAVKNDDKKTIESIKGIGKKMAEKIVLELKDKDFIELGAIGTDSENVSVAKLDKDKNESVKSTLSAMGYNPRDIDRVLEKLPEGLEEVGEIIPYVIRELS